VWRGKIASSTHKSTHKGRRDQEEC